MALLLSALLAATVHGASRPPAGLPAVEAIAEALPWEFIGLKFPAKAAFGRRGPGGRFRPWRFRSLPPEHPRCSFSSLVHRSGEAIRLANSGLSFLNLPGRYG